jgi:TolB-like protein
LARKKAERKLTAILAADVVGYSRLVAQDEPATLRQFAATVDEVFDPAVKSHHGRVVKTMGDGLLVEFGSVVEALQCALDVQHAMQTRNAKAQRRMEFRIGINAGDVVAEKGDIFGEGVNIASRLETLADPAGICISERVHEDVLGRVKAKFEDIGDQHLKNMDRPVHAFRVVMEHSPAPQSPLALPDKPSLAVLPLLNMSEDPAQEYFADAIAEDLLTALSRWRAFFVIARNSSFIYKGRAIDVRKVGQELGIRYVLEGSVRKVGERVRITAQLLDATNGAHLWAERFDRQLVDILALQDEITTQVAQAIEPALLQSENIRLSHKSLKDYTAFDCYQRGMWHLNKVSRDGYVAAVELFREAIARDPQMSFGFVGLSRILYGGATFYGWSERPDDDLKASHQAAARAIELDPNDACAHFAFAGAALYLGQHVTALDAAQRAIALNPNFALAYQRYGQVLIYCGRPAEAIEPIERCIRHSPFDPQLGSILALLAHARYQAKDYEEATVHARAAIQHDFAAGYAVLAASLARLGRIEEARKVMPPQLLARAITDSPRLATYVNSADRDHLLGGLALAGIGTGKAN